MHRVLILGAGLVAKPMIEYLLGKGFIITVASPMKEKADQMIGNNPRGRSVDWSMDDPATLGRMTGENDMIVSLLPYQYHVKVAEICLEHKKPLVTTSYVHPEMQALDSPAKKAGIIFLNEIGLDPGIDHMSAMKIIDHIHAEGGEVEEFWSVCGALPAPEAADNPLRYKFSWSPKGVVLASRNGAHYLKDGKEMIIEPVNLFKDRFKLDFPGIGEMEVYPNRDSISYKAIYGIPETRTMYRGTFRHPGWCETLDAIKDINMLDDKIKDYSGYTYSRFTAEMAGIKGNLSRLALAGRLNTSTTATALDSFEWLGLLDDTLMGYSAASPFEIVSDLMISKMSLRSDERDMVALQHIFVAKRADGRREKITSSMLDYGTPATNTAIARTVALPAAIAVKLILDKKILITGVHRPVLPEIYKPVLSELAAMGIVMKEEYGLSI